MLDPYPTLGYLAEGNFNMILSYCISKILEAYEYFPRLFFTILLVGFIIENFYTIFGCIQAMCTQNREEDSTVVSSYL